MTTPEAAAKNTSSVPKWVPITGAGFGGLTLIFFMALVLLSLIGYTIPENSWGLVSIVLALGVALSFAFLGGQAAAEGRIPIPGLADHPLVFSVGGGIAVFVIVLLLSNYLFAPKTDSDTPEEAVEAELVVKPLDRFDVRTYAPQSEDDETRLSSAVVLTVPISLHNPKQNSPTLYLTNSKATIQLGNREYRYAWEYFVNQHREQRGVWLAILGQATSRSIEGGKEPIYVEALHLASHKTQWSELLEAFRASDWTHGKVRNELTIGGEIWVQTCEFERQKWVDQLDGFFERNQKEAFRMTIGCDETDVEGGSNETA